MKTWIKISPHNRAAGKIQIEKRWSFERKEIQVRMDETKIDDFLYHDDGLLILWENMNIEYSHSISRIPIEKRWSFERKEIPVTLSKVVVDSELRAIVATQKQRAIGTHVDIITMKVSKFLYDMCQKVSFFSKKTLVNNYSLYLKMTTFSRFIKRINMIGLIVSLQASQFFKNIALEKQEYLVENKYYTKRQVFAENQLYQIAVEVKRELIKNNLKPTIKNIQTILDINYRQARNIYLKMNAL